MKKIALIGIGKMGLSHLAIANQTSGIEVAAVCDTSKPLLRILEKNTTFKGYSDYKKMIDEVSLDGIMINVPNAFHFDIARYCIEKGINIFVEKPLTLSHVQTKILVELSVDRGVKGQVGYVNRFNPVFQRVKKFLEDGVIGDVVSYSNSMVGGVILSENKGWRNDYAKGGGCLFDYGVHCFDLATYFFGTDVKVQSSVLKKVFSTNVDDIVYVDLLHDNHIVGSNYINWSDSSVRKATNNIEIIGKKGKIVANKQELSVDLTESNELMNLKKGLSKFYITDENTNVNYYLRGEDFSRQLDYFSKILNGTIQEPISSLFSASITDKIIEDAFILAGKGLHNDR
jgi:predicted dehydrogenase